MSKSRKLFGTILAVMLLVVSAGTMIFAATGYSSKDYFLEGIRMNTAYGNYTEEFSVPSSVPTPYIKYQKVYTAGDYGVTSLYQNGSSFKIVTAKTYTASAASTGLVLTGTKFKPNNTHKVLVYRRSVSKVDIGIEYLLIDI